MPTRSDPTSASPDDAVSLNGSDRLFFDLQNPQSPAESIFTEEMNALSPAAQIQGFNAPVSPQSPSSSIVDGLDELGLNSPDPDQNGQFAQPATEESGAQSPSRWPFGNVLQGIGTLIGNAAALFQGNQPLAQTDNRPP